MQRSERFSFGWSRLFLATVFCISAEMAHANEPSANRCVHCDQGTIAVTAVPGHPAWVQAQSRNFRIVCHRKAGNSKAIARHCEKLRGELCERWFPKDSASRWDPPCQVIVHQNSASYLQAVGRGLASTSGSADVRTEAGKIVLRRVDLRADKPNLLTAALPHEMTHVVMADWTNGKALPLWADEGMAMLADSAEKRARHARDLESAVASRTAFEVADLLSMDSYPGHDRWPTFYAQSHALVDYLVKRHSHERFAEFLRSASSMGYDSALQKHYDIRSVGALRVAWRPTAVSPRREQFEAMPAAKERLLTAQQLDVHRGHLLGIGAD